MIEVANWHCHWHCRPPIHPAARSLCDSWLTIYYLFLPVTQMRLTFVHQTITYLLTYLLSVAFYAHLMPHCRTLFRLHCATIFLRTIAYLSQKIKILYFWTVLAHAVVAFRRFWLRLCHAEYLLIRSLLCGHGDEWSQRDNVRSGTAPPSTFHIHSIHIHFPHPSTFHIHSIQSIHPFSIQFKLTHTHQLFSLKLS